VWSREYYSRIIDVSINGETRCVETTYALESEGPLVETHASGIPTVARHKRVR
jgi:hypothetical protein